jgi:bacterial leucyl aminopeptidase
MNKLWTLMLMMSFTAIANDNPYLYITIGSDAVKSTQKSFFQSEKIESSDEISVLKIHRDDIDGLSHLMHENFNRCGGFIVHESEEEAREVMHAQNKRAFAKNMMFADYTITEEVLVENLLNTVDEFSIRSTILKLSSFHNRYYKAQTGVDSQAWLKSHWEKLAQNRSDVKVEYFKHSSYPQPSVVLTVEGASMADEVIVIGGHADSIAGWMGRERARAPGADDNASGIATITEAIRVVMQNGYKPQRTIKFMAYAAEEVGLLGSKDIANSFKKAGLNVVGVVQLDMTNFKGTADKDIVFMTDYTNQQQTAFMGKLIDRYVKVPWGYSKCGYACSDHASWHNAGFPASMPFESTMGDINKHIHTDRDLIDNSSAHAEHAEKFARLAVAFLVEMGK